MGRLAGRLVGTVADVIACPACGTANPPNANWCNLCFAKFEATEPEPQVLADAPTHAVGEFPEPTGPPGEQLSLIADQRKTWRCRFCDTRVEVEEVSCPVCQQSVYDSFGRDTETGPKVDPAVALKWSLIPGGGHGKVGQGVLGVAIGLGVLISVGFGLVMVRSGRISYGAALTFIGLGTWLASAHDVLRITRNETDEVLLRPRIISVITGVMFMIVIGAAVSAQPVINQ